MNALVLHNHADTLPTALARDVARLPIEAIHQGFLSSPGVPFLATLHEGLAASRSSFVITATRGADTVSWHYRSPQGTELELAMKELE